MAGRGFLYELFDGKREKIEKGVSEDKVEHKEKEEREDEEYDKNGQTRGRRGGEKEETPGWRVRASHNARSQAEPWLERAACAGPS